ncbi:ABC transporter permease [Microbacterium sp. A84]|uniref:ABC transporter permease n=1 Tax=Microbacterium sp. A84 TaxID=3450715 RepID=UPI003F429D4C
MSRPPLSRKEAREDSEHTPDPQIQDGTDAKAAQRAKAEGIVRTAMIFIMPLIIVGMMITGYLATMHSPAPHDMPIAVVGSSSATESLTQALEKAEHGAVAVQSADTALDAREQVISRDVAGAIVIDGSAATVYTANAAGATQATVVTSLVTPALLAEGLTVTAEDLVPLPDNDMAGLGAMFLATALIMAGYLPFSVLRSNSPELLKFRRIVPLLAGWAALIAGLVWVVTGPVLGVVTSDHYVGVLGVAWLGVFAVSCVQLFITRVFGPLGVIAGMFLLMVLGMPASNMSISVHMLPSFFGFLHDILPMAAIGEAMRSVLYFDGVGVASYLLVLAIGAVAGLLATAAWDKFRGRRHPEGVPTDVTMPSLHGGPRPKKKIWRYLSLLFFPLAMVTMMIVTMLGAMHQPTPRDMPVAVVGTTVEQAEETIAGLEENMTGLFTFTPYAAIDEEEVSTLVENRDLVAGLVLPSQNSPEFTLIANEAGSTSAYQVVAATFTQVASAQQIPLKIDDVAPLPDIDSQGIVTMYIAMGWILAGFMVVVVGANAAPATRPLRRMLPLTGIYAVFMSAVLWLIAGPITGAVEGHFLALWGAGIVAIFSVAMFALVLERLIGMLATIPVVGILMLLGVPSSNAALSIYMAPEWFRTLYDFLPMPAAAETVRSILYFNGDVVTHHLQVLSLWGLISLALVFVIDSLKPVRTEHDFGDLATPSATALPTPAAPATDKKLILTSTEVADGAATADERAPEPATI